MLLCERTYGTFYQIRYLLPDCSLYLLWQTEAATSASMNNWILWFTDYLSYTCTVWHTSCRKHCSFMVLLVFFSESCNFFFLEFILLNWLCIIHLIPCDYLNFYYILWQKPLQSLKTFLSFIYIQTTSSNFLLMQVFSFIALKNVWCALDNTVIIMCRMCGE